MLKIRQVRDGKSGRLIQAVGQEGLNSAHGYFTAMTWQSDSRHLVLGTNIQEESMLCSYAAFDTETGDEKVLVEEIPWGSGVVSGRDQFYYIRKNEIWGLDLLTHKSFLVCRNGEGKVFGGPLSISNDCKVLGVFWSEGEDWVIGRVHAETGEIQEVIRPGFAKPYNMANHAMINPVDTNLIFYAHEGKTEHIPDRIWVADSHKGTTRNIFKQKLTEDGSVGECVGHEMWSFQGESLFFVKYPQSPSKPTGIYRVDKEGEGWKHINGDYPYWHVGVSPDGKWAVSDTHPYDGISRIVLIGIEKGSSEVLCEIRCWWKHPGHPHPSFSPDSKKVTFTFADDENKLWVGLVDIGS